MKQILNRYPMLEEDRNYIANLASGGGNSCNCPAVLEVDFNNDANDSDIIILSNEEHDFIMKNYLNFIFKGKGYVDSDIDVYYKPYYINKEGGYISFHFKQNIFGITGDGDTNKYVYYNSNTHKLGIDFPPM